MDDPTSPFFLHSSDHPGLVLVSQPLVGDNYSSWSRSLKLALSVKNKTGFIDGSLQAPVAAENPQQHQQWLRNNNMVISWILNSVSKEITPTIIGYTTAAEIWKDLKDRFQQQNGPRLYQIKKDLMNLQQGNLSMSNYFTQMKALWDEMQEYRPTTECNCGGLRPILDHFQSEQVMQFLMGLNDQFAQARAQILLMEPIPPINKVFSLIIQEERQRSIGSGSESHADAQLAFATKTFSQKGKGQKKDRPVCAHCGITGHTIDKCYKIHGYPPGYKFKGKNTSIPHSANQVAVQNSGTETSIAVPANQYQQLLALLASHITQNNPVSTEAHDTSNPVESGIVLSAHNSFVHSSSHWIIDSGATCHIAHNIASFSSISPTSGIFVTLPNNNRVPVHFIGTVKFNSEFILENVFYVPSFNVNIFSVSAFLKQPHRSVIFLPNTFLIQDTHTLRMIGKGNLLEGLYVLQVDQEPEPSSQQISSLSSLQNNVACNIHTSNKVSVETWHARLGHISNQRLRVLKDLLPTLPTFNNKSSSATNCPICPLAKQKRLSFSSNNHMSSSIFDLIHCDIWGPFHVATHTGHKYFLSIVDDHSRYVWIHLLHSKSEASKLLQNFVTWAETQFGITIKAIRSDNAPELKITEFLETKGIDHQFSCVERPQQNSVVERKFQHLLNVARALYFHSRVPLKFWG